MAKSFGNFKEPFNRLSFSVKFLILVPILISVLLLTYIAQNKAIQTSVDNVDAARRVKTINPSTIFLNPLSDSVRVGQTFNVDVAIKTDDNPINAVEANISYPTKYLQVVSTTVDESVFDITIRNTATNGNINLILGSTRARVGTLKVATITFKALAKANAQVIFKSPLNVVGYFTNSSLPYNSSNGTYRIR